MGKPKEIQTDLGKYVIFKKDNDGDNLFAVTKEDHEVMLDVLRVYDMKPYTVPVEKTVPALRMGKVGEVNAYRDIYDIISNQIEYHPISSLEGIAIKIGNW
jgi:hypothetical protein